QAEDGIRYFHVTGVQTCALPIFSGAVNAVQAVARARVTVRVPPAGDPKTTVDAVVEFLRQVAPWGVQVSFGDFTVGSGFQADSRSEERRVRQECRSQW